MGSGAGDIYENTFGGKSEQESTTDPDKTVERHSISTTTQPQKENVGSSIVGNLEKVSGRFELHEDGFFCDRGTGRDESFRQHVSSNPIGNARNLFDSLGYGGRMKPLDNGKGVQATLDDLTRITFRSETNTPNSPAVNIGRSASPKVKNQKIHFIEGDQHG